tara:strand:- start:96 stop:317 length:222 start_codon:yes stop_codon:yes gene_type:complete
LWGISRDYVLEISNQINFECVERSIEPYDVYATDKAFMTGAPFCILPVTPLNILGLGMEEWVGGISQLWCWSI